MTVSSQSYVGNSWLLAPVALNLQDQSYGYLQFWLLTPRHPGSQGKQESLCLQPSQADASLLFVLERKQK